MIEVNDEDLIRAEKLSARLEQLGNSLKRKCDEAVAARKSSGIEEEWTLAEEAYQGIDDANRGTVVGKPSSPDGGYVNGKASGGAARSTVLLNITRPYVDAAAARVGDMLLPTDDRNWCIKPTPIPVTLQGLMAPQQPQQQGMPPEMAAMLGQSAPAGQPIGQPVNHDKAAAEGAEKQIDDWLVQCQWHAEVRKLIEDCARLGTGILKGPYPAKTVSRVMSKQDGLMAMVIKESIGPESRCISPWNFFPDGDCGESIHDGAYVWEKDTITAKGLRDLKGLPSYIDSQIDKVLGQGPQGKYNGSDFQVGSVKAKDSDVFEIWYYHGTAERDDLIAAGVDLPEDGDVSVSCVLTMVNDTVIKGALNPLDSGEFPYDAMPWQRKQDLPWGTGIAVQINTPQRMLTAAARNMMDNAGLSAGPQIIMRRDAITPADNVWNLTPRKIWWVNNNADVAAVNQAFMTVNIPTMQAELHSIIQLALKMAEDVTGLPMLMQGQQGQAPETVGGMTMLNNNASSVLRRIARLFDDRVTEPHIRRYYDWLMTYGEDDAIKGDFQIDARGSSALVERDLQNQAILQMGTLVMNPAFGVDPEKWFQEALKAQRLDPKRFLLDDEKKAAMAQQAPPPPPQIQAAQIRAEADAQKVQMQLQADAQQAEIEAQVKLRIAEMQTQAQVEKMRIDTDRDHAYVMAQTQRDQTNAQAKMAELQIKRELAMLEYALREKLSLETVKAKLASDAMKLQVQKELAGADGKGPQIVTPIVEPQGRAPEGEAFQK